MKLTHSKASYIGLLLCMGLTLSAFMCSGSDLHKANRAAKQLSDDLHECVTQAETEFNAGNLTAGEATDIANACSDATLARGVFANKLKTISAIDSSNAAEVNAWFQDLALQVGKIGEKVGHIKSAASRDRFQLLVQSIASAMTIVQTLLVSPKPPAVSGSGDNQPIQRAGLDFGPGGIAFVLSMFNSLANLILKWRADGALTDEQLQAAGEAQDEDTRNHAAEFVKRIEGK